MKNNVLSKSYISLDDKLVLKDCSHENRYEAFDFKNKCLKEICKDCGKITKKV